MGLFNLMRPSRKVVVIDTVALNESLGQKGKVPPRNQLQLLRRLSRFAQREKLTLVAVLTGSILNKAPAGKKFEGITILYSKSIEQHARYLARVAASRGGVLVSGNAAAEKIFGRPIASMHISTFRKAFDTGGEGEVQERSENPRNRGNRSRRRQPPRQTPSAAPQTERERPPREMSDADAINELIDLVD